VPRPRRIVAYVAAYAATAAVAMLPVFLDHNWHAFWRDSISYQAGRSSPFSVWGLWGGLGFEQHVVEGAAAMLAVLVALFPRGSRTLVQTAALGAAVLIALQLGISHWFYLYIVWFFPLVIVALLGAEPTGSGDSGRRLENLFDRLRSHRLSGSPDHDAVQPRVIG
jgi:hypothetical protein